MLFIFNMVNVFDKCFIDQIFLSTVPWHLTKVDKIIVRKESFLEWTTITVIFPALFTLCLYTIPYFYILMFLKICSFLCIFESVVCLVLLKFIILLVICKLLMINFVITSAVACEYNDQQQKDLNTRPNIHREGSGLLADIEVVEVFVYWTRW